MSVDCFGIEEPTKLERIWWKTQTFFENWIYPGYYLNNYLFKKYNIIELSMFKKYEYVEFCDKMKFANFELIKEFIESDPEKHVCWYKDEDGQDVGHKYGDYKDAVIMFPERKGEWIMDIIKEIYLFYTKQLPELNSEHDYLLSFWSTYIWNSHFIPDENDKELDVLIVDPPKYTLEELEKKEDIKWNIIDSYIERDKIFVDNKFHEMVNKLDCDIQKKIQYYLHLCIEVREYLWT